MTPRSVTPPASPLHSAVRASGAAVAMAIVAASGCSSGDDGGSSSGGAGAGSGAGAGAGAAGRLFGGDGTGSSGAGGSSGGGLTQRFIGEDGCVAEASRAETIPLDIYVMFDQSGSMRTPAGAGSRLDAVRAAAADFLNDERSQGIGIGIGYFGHFPTGETSCDATDYSEPAVTIGVLPDRAGAILTSLNGVQPVGETPTGAAIRGACDYARGWKQGHPGHTVVILLVTDGVPEAPVSSQEPGGCSPTLADAVAATRDCATASPSVPTYVLGVGPSLDNLGQIADAGTTGDAYLVAGGDVSAQVLEALNDIRGDATIPCELEIPDPPAGESINFTQINVVYTDPSDEVVDLFNTVDASGCDPDAGGWYYDDPASPERIHLCEATCGRVTGQVGGELQYALGCDTVVVE